MTISQGTWTVLMVNYEFTLYMALASVFWCSVLHLVNAKWRYEVRFLMASATALFPLGFVLLLLILAFGDKSFFWWRGETFGQPLNAWHDKTFFVAREIILYLLVWGFCAYFAKLQRREFPHAPRDVRWRFRNVALLVPFVYCVYATIVGWDLEMTQQARWWSPLYGAYHFESFMRAFLAFFIIGLFILRQRDVLRRPINDYVFNYLAQLLLALTIIWTYLFFAQYLVMWYGDLPEEIERFHKMMDGELWWLFWGFFFLNSFVPFFMLIFRAMRHSPALMLFPAGSILIGTFLEHYMWILSPGLEDIHHVPFFSSWMDVVITLAVFVTANILWDRKMKRERLYEKPQGDLASEAPAQG